MLQRLINQLLLYYLSNGRLLEVRNNRKFPPFSCENGRGRFTKDGRLQEVSSDLTYNPAGSFTGDGRNQRFSTGSTV